MTVSSSGVTLRPGVPEGGTSGQVLAKNSGSNFDVVWIAAGGGTSEGSSTLTYTGTQLDRIDYASGNYKVFTYTGTDLTQMDYVQGATTVRRVYAYSGGNLISVTETTF